MTDENNQIKFFLYENWARTKTGQHTVPVVYGTMHGGGPTTFGIFACTFVGSFVTWFSAA